MANTHKHTPWRKAILVPFWVCQILLSLFMIAVFALALGVLANYNGSTTEVIVDGQTVDYGDVKPAVEGAAGVWLGLNSFCFILIIVEIVLLARHKLKPLTFVIMNAIKSAVWTTIFVFDIIGAVRKTGGYSTAQSAVGLVIEAGLLLCFLLPLMYGCIIYHRFRKNGGAYKPVDATRGNPAGEFGETAYPSQYTPFVQDHDVESGRTPGARRLSYNHQKDTRFESYRQASYGEPSPLETTVISNSPHVPNIHVDSYEMENSRTTLR